MQALTTEVRNLSSAIGNEGRPTLVGRTLYFTSEFFVIRRLISETIQRRPVKSISVVRSYSCRTKMPLKHFANHSVIQGSKSAEFWPQFSTPVAFEALYSFETEQHIRNLKHVAAGAKMNALNIDLEIWPTPPVLFLQGV